MRHFVEHYEKPSKWYTVFRQLLYSDLSRFLKFYRRRLALQNVYFIFLWSHKFGELWGQACPGVQKFCYGDSTLTSYSEASTMFWKWILGNIKRMRPALFNVIKINLIGRQICGDMRADRSRCEKMQISGDIFGGQ